MKKTNKQTNQQSILQECSSSSNYFITGYILLLLGAFIKRRVFNDNSAVIEWLRKVNNHNLLGLS